MLFNNLVSQFGGGTELTIVNVNISPAGSATYPIPESATLICFSGYSNGDSGAIYKRTESGIVKVKANLNYPMEITPSSDAITISSKSSYRYDVTGILAYK